MADESPGASSCVHCGRSCACESSQGGEGSKRPASVLGAPTGDDVPSEELSKRLSRRTLDALHPKAVETLEPEFGVTKNGKRQLFQITFCCKVCGMAARSHVTGIDGQKTIKVSTSSTRTLDDAAKECAEELYRWHQKCLPTQHFLAQVGHKQELKLDDAKTEALRLQRQLENDASTLARGADVPLNLANRKDFDGNDMEKHVCAHFAAPRGARKTDEAKRQRVEPAGDVFDALMDSEQHQRTPSRNLQRGRLHRAMHDATFGVLVKVVPYLRFWAFGSVTRCAFSHTAHACVRAHFADARAMLQDGGTHRRNRRASRRRRRGQGTAAEPLRLAWYCSRPRNGDVGHQPARIYPQDPI
jgi:hypothetical protein